MSYRDVIPVARDAEIFPENFYFTPPASGRGVAIDYQGENNMKGLVLAGLSIRPAEAGRA
jgi:hypothetical protein